MISPAQWDLAEAKARVAALLQWADTLPAEDRRRVEWLVDEIGDADAAADEAQRAADFEVERARVASDEVACELGRHRMRLDAIKVAIEATYL